MAIIVGRRLAKKPKTRVVKRIVSYDKSVDARRFLSEKG